MQSTGDAAGETKVARRRVGNIELDVQGFWTDHKSGTFGLCPPVSAGVRGGYVLAGLSALTLSAAYSFLDVLYTILSKS